MRVDIYLRPLRTSDARKSWEWRNDPDIWALTGRKPTMHITKEIETEWIKEALSDKTSRRFAICVRKSDEYIGNIQLTDITETDAQLHIFIGNKSYWGRGVATQAVSEMVKWAWSNLNTRSIYLLVDRKNTPAIRAYVKNGFEPVTENYSRRQIRMILKRP